MKDYLIQLFCQSKKIYENLNYNNHYFTKLRQGKLSVGIDIISMNYVCVYIMTHLNIAGLSKEP